MWSYLNIYVGLLKVYLSVVLLYFLGFLLFGYWVYCLALYLSSNPIAHLLDEPRLEKKVLRNLNGDAIEGIFRGKYFSIFLLYVGSICVFGIKFGKNLLQCILCKA